MTEALVGVDLGGTKVQVAVATRRGLLINEVRPSFDWATHPWSDAAKWLAELLDDIYPPWRAAAALVVGAHGCDSPRQTAELRDPLLPMTTGHCQVLNDAHLVVPAAGLRDGVGLIVGTGSIAAGTAGGGQAITAGGWGWILGDEGSAPGLVREALRAVLRSHDRGLPPDRLGVALLQAFGATSPPDLLALASVDAGKQRWGQYAEAVFEAARASSDDALEVIHEAARSLSRLVEQLASRGANADVVVLAGGVIQNQPTLADRVDSEVRRALPGSVTRMLEGAPVRGALCLAWRALDWSGNAPQVPIQTLGR